jgi:hypothetical protein
MVNIPREKVKEGMYLVKRNVLDLVDVARIIIRKDSTELYLRYAYGIIQIAIEELGKGLILKEGYINCHSSVIDIKNWVFGRGKKRKSHILKFEKAWEVLNEDLKIVHYGAYEKEHFKPVFYDTDIEASHKLRLDCVYVDYNEKLNRWGWFRSGRLDKDHLLLLLEDIEMKTKRHLLLEN